MSIQRRTLKGTASTSDATPIDAEGEPEPNLFDDPPRERSAAAPEAAPPLAASEAAPIAAAPAPAESAPEPADVPAPAIDNAPAPASEPAAKADIPAPEATPAEEDPSRPRRSGWWQRARATLSGE